MKNFILTLGCSLIPVIVIELNLNKVPSALFQQHFQAFRSAVKREAKIFDLPCLLPFLEIRDASAAFVISRRQVGYAMKQIEVNVFYLKPVQLVLKLEPVIRIGLDIELVGDAVTLPRITGKGLSQNRLRLPP